MLIRVTAKDGLVGDFTMLQELIRGNAISERSLGKIIAMLLTGVGYEFNQVEIAKEGGQKI
jgi:hypothetical protein